MTDKAVSYPELPSFADIDAIVYTCRQAGDDTTYAIVRRAIEQDRARAAAPQAAVGVSNEAIEGYIATVLGGRDFPDTTPGTTSYWLTADELRDMINAISPATKPEAPAAMEPIGWLHQHTPQDGEPQQSDSLEFWKLTQADEKAGWSQKEVFVQGAAVPDAEVLADAERYRWLSDRSGADVRSLLDVGDFTSLDAFIDRALRAGRQKGGV